LADYEATVRALKKNGINNPIHHCQDGDDALRYLSTTNKEDPPSLVMLDLNMPGTDGIEVLKEARKSAGLNFTPIIIMTTSTNQQDVKECLHLGANSYVQKPVSSDGFHDAVRRIKEFWFELAVYPEG
jgi:two-component system response regulator